jgi:hypothetical protein
MCTPIETSCYRSDVYQNGSLFANCTNDSKLCSYDPNYENSKLIAIIAVVSAVVIILAICVVICVRYYLRGKKKFSTQEKFQVFGSYE